MIAAIPPIQPFPATAGASGAAGATGAGTAGGGFAHTVTQALGQVQQVQNNASQAEALAAAGQGTVADAMISATQASLATQVTVALTNRAVSAFTDVMNLQL